MGIQDRALSSKGLRDCLSILFERFEFFINGAGSASWGAVRFWCVSYSNPQCGKLSEESRCAFASPARTAGATAFLLSKTTRPAIARPNRQHQATQQAQPGGFRFRTSVLGTLFLAEFLTRCLHAPAHFG